MLRFLTFLGAAIVALYLSGVTPDVLKARIEAARSENASINALSDPSNDWG